MVTMSQLSNSLAQSQTYPALSKFLIDTLHGHINSKTSDLQNNDQQFNDSSLTHSKNKTTDQLDFYPNPVQQAITIIVKSKNPEGLISIYTSDKKLLYSFKVFSSFFETKLDVSYLSAGVYQLIYNDGKKDLVRQFIKN